MDDVSLQISQMINGFDERSRLGFLHSLRMAREVKRNDQCWCQSGKKYKKCHLDRHSGRLITEGEVRKELSKIFDKRKYCCASFDSSNCEMPIKGAHTVQRGRVLSSIAESGHVGTFYRNMNGYEKERDYKSGVKKEASIFYGFCSFHDTELFENIELREFTSSSENCWSSSYRSVCHEFYQKTAAKEGVSWYKESFDQGRPLEEQLVIQEKIYYLNRDILKGLEDISLIKKTYEDIKLSGEFDRIESYVVCFDNPLQVTVSATMSPYYDINNVKIQNLGIPDANFEHFAISTVTIGGSGAYIISYLKKHKVISGYLSDVFNRDIEYIKNWLMKSIFAYAENTFFSLSWWEAIPDESKKSIFKLAMRENYTVPFDVDSLVSKEVDGNISSINRI